MKNEWLAYRMIKCDICSHKLHTDHECTYRKACECRRRSRIEKKQIVKSLRGLFSIKKNSSGRYHRTADLRMLTDGEYKKIMRI